MKNSVKLIKKKKLEIEKVKLFTQSSTKFFILAFLTLEVA